MSANVPQPVNLALNGLRLTPIALSHVAGLQAAAADGELWKLRVTSVPEPADTQAYVEAALEAQRTGSRLAFAVLDSADVVIGTTGFHDILPALGRLDIGYTWYAARCQRSHVNTTCKLMLLTHAFETLDYRMVGWRTDNFNFASQRAIERLGAKKDGVVRGHALRRDGTIRDTVMYSLAAGEWPEVRAHLLDLLAKRRASGASANVPANA